MGMGGVHEDGEYCAADLYACAGSQDPYACDGSAYSYDVPGSSPACTCSWDSWRGYG